MFFFLLQTEQGDIFKVTLDTDDDLVSMLKMYQVRCCWLPSEYHLSPFQVTRIRIKYFDTVPVCTSMCVLKTGLLFCASEFGNQ